MHNMQNMDLSLFCILQNASHIFKLLHILHIVLHILLHILHISLHILQIKMGPFNGVCLYSAYFNLHVLHILGHSAHYFAYSAYFIAYYVHCFSYFAH
jgi:hypothetical protein